MQASRDRCADGFRHARRRVCIDLSDVMDGGGPKECMKVCCLMHGRIPMMCRAPRTRNGAIGEETKPITVN